jgi:predicted CXXCH cytochrome family protein
MLAVALVVAGLVYGAWKLARPLPRVEPDPVPAPLTWARSRYSAFGRFGFWIGAVPAQARARALDTGTYSNIEPEDYAGPARCAGCHAAQYKNWSQHPHRFMNAAATPEQVAGDFRDRRIRYLGGEGRFWQKDGHFHMSAERGRVRREFRIARTIGSRYFQYYVGVQTAGPEPAGDPRYHTEHVLPFGYWLTKGRWVPTVHIREDRADDYDDPQLNPYEDFYFRDYDTICARCHTTLPLGDWLIRAPAEAGQYTPYPFSLDLTGYLNRQRPGLLPRPAEQVSTKELETLLEALVGNRPPARLLHLGIVCEACHNGCQQHAADPERVPPHFFPTSPLLYAQLPRDDPHGRTHANTNWICARCHTGPRPLFPGGMSTWNSAEYSDASRGSCYSQLRCVDCHDPHRATGPVWPHPADHDDRLCLKCHDRYRDAAARRAHTRHAPGSAGDRCLNCHMPRVNEGLDTVVRTHTISSPTKAVLIEQNGPNACNLCHLDRPIDWTLGYLKEWYGRTYDDGEIRRNYPHRHEPVGHGWLRHPFRATRLVAAAAYGRAKAPATLPVLLDILDDQYLLNRQFGQLAVEAVCGRALDRWGYDFTLAPAERAAVLPKVRAALAPGKRE